MNSRASAARVGALVVISLLLAYTAVVFLGGRFGKHGAKYFVDMSDAGGMVNGTRVTMAGVRIGEVVDVRLVNPRLVRLVIEVDPKYHIPAGSAAEIPTSFISLGDSGLVIVPPTTIVSDLAPGSTLQGTRPGPLEGIFPDTKRTIETLNETLASARDLLRDQDLKGGVKRLLDRTDQTLAQFQRLAAQTNTLLAANGASITAAVRNAQLATLDVRRGADLAIRLLKNGHLDDQVKILTARLDAVGAKTEKLVDGLDGFVNDPKLRADLDGAVADAHEITGTGKQIAANVATITQNGEDVSAKAVALTQKASEVADEAKVLVTKLEGLVDKVSGKVDAVSKSIPRPLRGAVHAELDAIRETHPNYNRLDANFSANLFGRDVYFGVFDAFASNKLDLQLGRSLGRDLELRYGAYAGEAGLGVDYRLTPRLGLKTDVFGLNKPRFDALAKYELGSGFATWIGIDRIFDRNGLTFGIGLEK